MKGRSMSSPTTSGKSVDNNVLRVDLPTTEFDLDRTPRFNPANNAATGFRRYAGQTENDRLKVLRKEHIQGWAAAARPGFSLVDRALASAAQTLSQASSTNQGIISWNQVAGQSLVKPLSLGVEQFSASPEEAAMIVKSAARFFGASLVGVTSLREQWVLTHCNKKAVVIEDCDTPGETDETYVIPARCRWVISCAVEISRTGLERAPSAIGEAASLQAASRATLLIASLSQFIRSLGYVAIPDRADVLLQVPFAVCAGLGELGRLTKLITPEFGPAVRLNSVITDLPMAWDKPINCGLQDFCRSCRICAEACPAKAISFDEEPSWEPKGPWNNPGKRVWFNDATKCHAYRQTISTNCAVCFAACPWPRQVESPGKVPYGVTAERQREWWKTLLSP
ncbi:MAG: reductive dehalogenase, partial [Dehalococcoidia bacterium]|nr:reductive dehalogenase [Dehalococcoidia bacterium]